MRKCILGMTENEMKTLLGFFAVLFAVAVVVFSSALFSALAIATASSWILSGSFSDAWSASWEKTPLLLLWFVIFCIMPRIITFRKKGKA